MAEEVINIPLAVPQEFFDELDRRFEAMARRASASFGQAFKAGAGPRGTAGGGGEAPGGTSFGGAAGQAVAALISGAGQGVASTPAAAAFSPAVLQQNAALGAAQGGVNLLKTGLQAGGGAVGGLVGGPFGAAVGQALGGMAGDFIQSQFNSVKEAMEIPTERGIAHLKGIYGNLAAAGVQTTDAEREQAISFSQTIERKRYEGERQLERQYREFAARDSITYGLNFVGR